MKEKKTRFADTGGTTSWTMVKNSPILFVIIALLLSTSTAQSTTDGVTGDTSTYLTGTQDDPVTSSDMSPPLLSANNLLSTNNPQFDPMTSSDPPVIIPVPSNITITVNESDPKFLRNLKWDNVAGADGYIVDITCNHEWNSSTPCCNSCHEIRNITTPYITLTNLASDTNYSVMVAAVNGSDQGDFSEAIEFTTSNISDLRPVMPSIETDITNTSIILRWKPACFSSDHVRYLVEMQDQEVQQLDKPDNESCMYEIVYDNLDPFKVYNYSILAVKDGCPVVKSCGNIPYVNPYTTLPPETTEGTTVEDYEEDSDFPTSPAPPNEMDYRCSECHQGQVKTKPGIAKSVERFVIQLPGFYYEQGDRMTVNWKQPQPVTGVVERYHFIAQGDQFKLDCIICAAPRRDVYRDHYDKNNDEESCKNSCYNCRKYSETVTCNFQAKINSMYSLQVKAKNNNTDSFGPLYVENTTTTNNVWPYIAGSTFQRLTLREREKYSLHRQYPIKCIQNDFKGFRDITLYQILISEKQQNAGSQTYTTPDETEKYRTFKGTVVHNDTKLPSLFVFGDNEIFPLYASTKYYFIFRVYIDNNFRDSDEFNFSTEKNTLKDILVGVLIVFIVLILLGIIGYFVYQRYFSPIIRKGDSEELPLLLPKTVDDFAVKPIKLTVLFEEIDKRLSNGKDDLKKEFEELRISSPYKMCEVATDGFNVSKNRYVNILPFDETRVILDEYRDVPGSDYINASYIHGYDKSKEFIATQGPRESDLDTFWRMIWEKNVHTIVMVTNCVEARTQKCSKYWPDYSDPNKTILLPLVGMKIVTVEEESHAKDGYFRRVMQVTKDSTFFSFRSRRVTHFHFNNWPDMGCPRDPDNLISLALAVKGSIPKQSSHTIVHCSAGVGRTGTFIALSNLMEEMKVKDSVDVFQAVYRMRLNRVNMVQTLAQYEFLYKCVRRLYEQRKDETFRPDTLISLPDAPDVVTTTFSSLNVSDKDDPYENYENIELSPGNAQIIADQEEYPFESSDECEMKGSSKTYINNDEDGKTSSKEANDVTDTNEKDGRNSPSKDVNSTEKKDEETTLIDVPI